MYQTQARDGSRYQLGSDLPESKTTSGVPTTARHHSSRNVGGAGVYTQGATRQNRTGLTGVSDVVTRLHQQADSISRAHATVHN